MFNRIKEYFREPQIGDIWYFKPENPFDTTYKYLILEIKGSYVKVIPLGLENSTNEMLKTIRTNVYSFRYLKYVYKREINNA